MIGSWHRILSSYTHFHRGLCDIDDIHKLLGVHKIGGRDRKLGKD